MPRRRRRRVAGVPARDRPPSAARGPLRFGYGWSPPRFVWRRPSAVPLPFGVMIAWMRVGRVPARRRPAAVAVLLLLAFAAVLVSSSLLDAGEPAAGGQPAVFVGPQLPQRPEPPRNLVPRVGPIAAVEPSPEAVASTTATTKPCGFIAGFAALATELGRGVIGECLEDEHPDPAARVSRQGTTRGEFVWFWDSGAVSFTDGETTWYRCYWGVEQWPAQDRPPC